MENSYHLKGLYTIEEAVRALRSERGAALSEMYGLQPETVVQLLQTMEERLYIVQSESEERDEGVHQETRGEPCGCPRNSFRDLWYGSVLCVLAERDYERGEAVHAPRRGFTGPRRQALLVDIY